MLPTKKIVEKAFLVGVELPKDNPQEIAALVEELSELVKTAGFQVIGKEVIKLKAPNAKLLIGAGKAQLIIDEAKALGCEIIIFDSDLTPGQQRNWEKLSGLIVIDRQEVILEIFAQRAHTKEANLQVTLAQLEYSLPRLKRAWTHLSRQRGGGAIQRDSGETQLEIDQRRIKERIFHLKKDLVEVVEQRENQRKKRIRVPLPTLAIVGYTNAGKSSLLRALTGAEILVDPKLFATLDPTTRRLKMPNGQIALVTDTVGFIRKLPHRLIEAFKATLEEAVVADFLIHVVDISNPDLKEHVETTLSVLKELHAEDKPILTVFNKIDLHHDPIFIRYLKNNYTDSCFISTKTKEGFDDLFSMIEQQLEKHYRPCELLIPHNRYDLIHELHEFGAIQKEDAQAEGIYVKCNLPLRLENQVANFVIHKSQGNGTKRNNNQSI